MKRVLFCLIALVTLFLFGCGEDKLATKFSHIFYSDMNAVQTAREGWTEELNLLSMIYTISSNDHSSSLSFVVSNPENVTELNYVTYQRILMEDREHDGRMFIGRVENVILNEEQRTFTVNCRDYSLELAERHPNPDEARHAAFYMAGQRRDQLIDGLIVDYRYSGIAPISILVPSDGIPPWPQTGDVGITKDYRKSGLTVMGCIAELAEEAPWPAPFVGRGYEFYVFPSGTRVVGINQVGYLFRRGRASILIAEWGAPDVWTNTTKPLLAFNRNRKGEDVFSRAIVYGMGDVVGASTDAGMEAAWGGAGKQIIKEALVYDQSIQTAALAQSRAAGYLYANEAGLGGERVIELQIPGLPWANPMGTWAFSAPGDCIHVHYSPLAINADYIMKKIVYKEPECVSAITAERVSKRDIANYIEQSGKRAIIAESEHKQYYDSNSNNPGGVWTPTTGANPVIIVHNFGAIPRTIKVYGATNNAGADMCEGCGYHSVFTPPAGPTNYYGYRVESITTTTVVLTLNLTGFAFSITHGGWILNDGNDFYKVIVEP